MAGVIARACLGEARGGNGCKSELDHGDGRNFEMWENNYA
jgi:hypothetical protein